MAIGAGKLGGGNLGTLFINLTANPAGMVAGMKQAEATVVGGSKRMLAAATKMSSGVVIALAAIGVAAVVQFGQFEKAMTKSTAIMGDVSRKLRREMEATARTIATESVTSAEELADAYFFLASAGLSAEQSIGALNTVNLFAIAGQFDMALATDLLTDAQSALGLTVKDTTENMRNMTRISDVLVKANTLANATVQQFSIALTREAGAAMKSFNISVEEGVAVLAAFADQGVKAELAGTSFSRVLRLMTSAAVRNTDAYRELNIDVFDPLTKNIRNMADIIADLEDALGEMSDQERVVALATLGFKARVQGVILPLLDTSDAIREYQKNLERAGGTTEEVAEKQMKAFFDQLTITWNRIKDMLLTIGEGLTPALRTLNDVLQDVTTSNDDFNLSLGKFATDTGLSFIATVATIGDLFFGLKVLWKEVQIVFGRLAAFMGSTFITVLKTISKGVTKILDLFDKLQKITLKFPALRKVLGLGSTSDLVSEGIEELRGVVADLDAGLDEGGEKLKKKVIKLELELFGLVLKGKPSDRVAEGYEKAAEAIRKAAEDMREKNKEILKDSKETTDKIISDFDRVAKAQATSDIDERFTEAFGKPKVKGKLAEGGTLGVLGGTEGLDPASSFGLDPVSAQLERFQAEKTAAEENLEILEAIGNSKVELEADVNARRLQLMEALNDKVRALQLAQAEIVLNSASSMFGDLANISESFAGRQSGIFKAMFAVSKAFAIAESTVKIAQGIANAAGTPFPFNIAAIAQVVAATSGIISSIQAVQLEFGGSRAAGGRFTPGKSFLVGERGPEMATFDGPGSITPNNQLGGSKVNVVVNNFSDAQAEVRETENGDEKTIEVIIARTKNSIASDVRQGTGEVSKSLQASFGLRRTGR